MMSVISGYREKEEKDQLRIRRNDFSVDLVEQNLPTLRGKFSSTVTNTKKKKKLEDIPSQLNSFGYEKRTAVEVREKW